MKGFDVGGVDGRIDILVGIDPALGTDEGADGSPVTTVGAWMNTEGDRLGAPVR